MAALWFGWVVGRWERRVSAVRVGLERRPWCRFEVGGRRARSGVGSWSKMLWRGCGWGLGETGGVERGARCGVGLAAVVVVWVFMWGLKRGDQFGREGDEMGWVGYLHLFCPVCFAEVWR